MGTRSRASPRKTPRQERAKVTVDAILEAAAHILVSDGYEDTTTKRVAERAGVSIGSLYQYFPSKDALVMALAERHVEQMLALVERSLQLGAEQSPLETARRIAGALRDAYAVNPRLYQVLLDQGPRVGLPERVQVLERRMEGVVRAFLSRHARLLRPANVDLASFVVARACRGAMWAIAIERPELLHDPALVDELTALIVGYLMR